MRAVRLARLLVAVAASLAALTAAELFLASQLPIEGLVYRIDEELLVTTIPGSRKLFTRSRENGGDTILVRFNAAGYRGPELAPAGATRRVAVYGDSCVQAEFSAVEKTFVSLLANQLVRTPGRPVETVNAGVVGYGPDQAILRMEREADDLDADVVVLTLFGNDFGDLLRNKLFRLDSDGALAARRPVIAEEMRNELAPRRGLRRLHVVRGSLLVARDAAGFLARRAGLLSQRSQPGPAWRAYVEWTLREREREFREAVGPGNDVVRSTFEDSWDADIALRPGAESSRYKVELLMRLLERARRFTEARGTRLLLLLIPADLDACEANPWGAGLARHPAYRRSQLTDTFATIAAQLGIPAVNLFPVYRDNEPCSLYFRLDDDHWNDAGQRLAAEVVAQAILDKRLLPET